MFSTFDCTVKGVRQKEDHWNSIIAGFLTGGSLAIRGESIWIWLTLRLLISKVANKWSNCLLAGPKTAVGSGIMCGILLGCFEGELSLTTMDDTSLNKNKSSTGVGVLMQRMMAENNKPIAPVMWVLHEWYMIMIEAHPTYFTVLTRRVCQQLDLSQAVYHQHDWLFLRIFVQIHKITGYNFFIAYLCCTTYHIHFNLHTTSPFRNDNRSKSELLSTSCMQPPLWRRNCALLSIFFFNLRVESTTKLTPRCAIRKTLKTSKTT